MCKRGEGYDGWQQQAGQSVNNDYHVQSARHHHWKIAMFMMYTYTSIVGHGGQGGSSYISSTYWFRTMMASFA